MCDTVEYFEEKARFEDEDETELIQEKLERFVINILTEVEKRDKRFQGTLIKSGSVYEGVKVGQPDEFDFMIRIDSLINKPSFHPCDKGEGYTKLILQEQEWEEFNDDEGFFNPNLLSRFFKKLVNASLSTAELPEGLVIQRETQENWNETLWPIASVLLGNTDEKESSGAMYSTETHGPATTFSIDWQGGDSYRRLNVSLDLTPTLEFQLTKFPAQLSKLAQEINPVLQKCGFHVVPAGFDSWRISFSLAEKEILASSPDGFKACYRVLKAVRDDISKRLRWNPSLIPSYILKTILLSELFTKDRHLTWEKDYWSERIVQVLGLALEGVKGEKIPSFFIPTHNLLTVSDHDNKLRQCVLEDMLNQAKGLDLVYAREDVEEKKQQILVLKMIDLLDFMISNLVAGKNPTAVMKKMFVNIANFPMCQKTRWFWAPFTDFATLELDERAYKRLVQIWSWVEDFFTKLLATLEGETNLLAQKLYIRACEKKKQFESGHKGLLEQEVEQISPREVLFEWLEDTVDFYFEEENSMLPNLHKVFPSGLPKSGLFPDVADVTVKEGSDKGRGVLKQHLRKYIFMVPENYIVNTVVEYVSQMFLNGKEVWKQKLDFITIPELDLD